MSAVEQFKAAVTSEAVPIRDGAPVLSVATQALHKFICCLEIGY